ncbi:uncharacterized protein wu:fb74b10 isoform X3 [Ictalurus furcatus]|uniref:uncharacterized protein wu:fb74b10 isoform X3 n=1 Tax=Ictalurus furcatus TaxID=66913 RepID=UPI002350FF70|nr:uncharacterized protein wu:fb74b10 isoform X3 [Ictalurus furcatus]
MGLSQDSVQQIHQDDVLLRRTLLHPETAVDHAAPQIPRSSHQAQEQLLHRPRLRVFVCVAQVTVVENGCEDSSPAQVDVEIEADSMNKLEMNLDASKLSKQLSKRAFQNDDSDSVRSLGAKKPCSDKPSPQMFPKSASKRQCDEEDEDEEDDSASLRRIVCSTMEEKKDERWDGFSGYVTSCLRSLDSSQSRMRAQDDVCAVLQRHMERDGEDDDDDGVGDRSETCRRTCSTCCGSGRNTSGGGAVKLATPPTDDQDDLEPFLKSMSIIMKRLPEGERSEVKFRIHELVHKAQMKHLNEQRSKEKDMQNPSAL